VPRRKLEPLFLLIRARRHDPSSSATQCKSFIAIRVGQATADGESELVSVSAELDNIGQLVDGLAIFTRIDGDVEERAENDWVDLACHGLPNRKKPFESAFALCDGHFTIQHITGCNLENPEFAYLSACHTTVGDEECPDEVMQFAGLRVVIGTMWAVDESGRLDHTRAAFALNGTMKSVSVLVPFDQWILYIHLGA